MLKENNYTDWYVLQIKAGREGLVKRVLDESEIINIKTLLFSREIIHRKKNRDLRLTVPVFPGYIFILEKIKQACSYLKGRLPGEFIRPVAFDGLPAKVAAREMEYLLYHAGEKGLFSLSTGSAIGENIVFNNGPLKSMKGTVLFINRKKRKAKVRLALFQREMDISLGIEFIERNHRQERENEYCNAGL